MATSSTKLCRLAHLLPFRVQWTAFWLHTCANLSWSSSMIFLYTALLRQIILSIWSWCLIPWNQHQLKVNKSKCSFAQNQLAYLGYIIGEHGVSTDWYFFFLRFFYWFFLEFFFCMYIFLFCHFYLYYHYIDNLNIIPDDKPKGDSDFFLFW